MIYQVIDEFDERLRLWAGDAVGALRHRQGLQRHGRATIISDYKGRRLSASDLVECAARENDRQATSTLAEFKQMIARG